MQSDKEERRKHKKVKEVGWRLHEQDWPGGIEVPLEAEAEAIGGEGVGKVLLVVGKEGIAGDGGGDIGEAAADDLNARVHEAGAGAVDGIGHEGGDVGRDGEVVLAHGIVRHVLVLGEVAQEVEGDLGTGGEAP